MERVYGAADAEMQADLDWDTLQSVIKLVGGMKSPDTRLHIDLKGRDPDEGQTELPYQKGATFLRTIEAALGRERWDAYLRDYFDRHAFSRKRQRDFCRTCVPTRSRAMPHLRRSWAWTTGCMAWACRPMAVHVKSQAFVRMRRGRRGFASKGGAGSTWPTGTPPSGCGSSTPAAQADRETARVAFRAVQSGQPAQQRGALCLAAAGY